MPNVTHKESKKTESWKAKSKPRNKQRNKHRKLRISIITQDISPTMTDELIPVLIKRGHNVSAVSFTQFDLTNIEKDAKVKSLYKSDIVYYRTGLEPIGAMAVERLLRKKSIPFLNGVYGKHPYITSKKYQVMSVALHGIKLPKTIIDNEHNFDKITKLIGVPFICKASVSSQGKDVHLIASKKDYENLLKLNQSNVANDVLYQEYIEHDCDYRVHFLGNEPVAIYRRVSRPTDFRTNVSVGGIMESVETALSKKLFKISKSVSEIFGVDISAIDFIESSKNGELFFCEINTNPGWERSDKQATNVNMNQITADYIEKRAKKSKKMNGSNKNNNNK